MNDQTTALVSASDLSVEYWARDSRSRYLAVKGVTSEVLEDEVLGIIGDAGSGKSTLAATIAGLADDGRIGSAAPNICGGNISVLGTELRRVGRRARDRVTLRVGYLAQDGAQRLNAGMTVAENIAEPIFQHDRRFDAREAGQAVATLVDGVHLPLAVLEKMPYELSSGQRQRVALARSLILEPALLVADEPIRGVDVMVRHDVLDVIPELRAERGFAAVIVSSDLAIIAEMSSRVAVMHDGIFVGLGPLHSLMADAGHPYLKSLAQAFRQLGLKLPQR